LISAIISIFYYIYKSYFIKRNIKLIILNLITLVILLTALFWVADTRLDFIAENEVPIYRDEALYDSYRNKIFISKLDYVEPIVEIVEKTESKLALHVVESCACEQASFVLDDYFPDDTLEKYIDGMVSIFSDIEVIYNDDHTIASYTISETRNIEYMPENLSKYYGYVSMKLEITQEYKDDGIEATYKDYFYSTLMNENDYQNFSSNDHYVFNDDEASVSYYRLKKSIIDDEVTYLIESQIQDEDTRELVTLHRNQTESGGVIIDFEADDSVFDLPAGIISYGPIKVNLVGSLILEDDYYEYFQEYDQMNVELAHGHFEIYKSYETEFKYISDYDMTVDEREIWPTEFHRYEDMFSPIIYVEIVRRRGTILENIYELVNPFEIRDVIIYEIEKQEYGYRVANYIDSTYKSPSEQHYNSSVYEFIRSDIYYEFVPTITGYFDYTSMLLSDSYHFVIYDNNEMINYIVNDD
jgi:hypothetical protein